MIDGSMSAAPAVAPPQPRERHLRPDQVAPAWHRLLQTVDRTAWNVLSSPLVLAWLFTFAAAATTAYQVRDYYLVHLPHFDSIGAYLYAFNVMNVTEARGLRAGIALAANSNLGWLTPFYALPFSWTSYRAPAALITLNFVLMALTQLAMLDWCRLNGYSRRHQLVILLLPFLFGSFYTWDGGLQDWRRDAQLNVLLIGDFFLSLAYVQRPTVWRGLALGAMIALTQLSRDNALTMVALVVFPAIVLAIVGAWRAAGGHPGRAGLALFRLAWLPIGLFVLLTLPYYVMTWEATLFRYTYMVWGPGEDRLRSLMQFWTSPYDVLFGGTTMFNGKAGVAAITRVMLLVGLAMLAALLVTRVVYLSSGMFTRQRSRLLLASGGFVVVAVILYNTVGLGYGAQYHGVPFFPVMVGMTAIFAALTDLIRVSPSCCRQTLAHAALGLMIVALIPTNGLRIWANEFDNVGRDAVEGSREAALKINEAAGGRPVAVFYFDRFSTYHINYFLAQMRRSTIAVPEKIDGPLRNGETPEQWFTRMRQSTGENAGVVVVNTVPGRYSQAAAEPGLLRDGAAFIQSLLDDPQYEVIYRFQIAQDEFAILNNKTLPKR
jgi:hypothetical protein